MKRNVEYSSQPWILSGRSNLSAFLHDFYCIFSLVQLSVFLSLLAVIHYSCGWTYCYRQYRRNSHYNVTHRKRQNFYALPSSHWQLLADPPFNYLQTLERVDEAIDNNAIIAEAILRCGLRDFGLSSEPEKGTSLEWHGKSTGGDVSKAHSTIRQLYRDWSLEGKREREIAFEAVFKDLDNFAVNIPGRSQIRILVPGAGLGRLVFDLCLRGYSAEGNEISYHQLLTSSWVLNNVEAGQRFALYPFVTQFTNNRSRTHQLHKVEIPDVHPGAAISQAIQNGHRVGEMNMTASDFLVLYNNPSYSNSFDVVTTVFFIDTAPNLIRYIETIRNCLCTGGIWVNIGPLLWHFDDRAPANLTEDHTHGSQKDLEGIAEPGSFEPTDEEVLLLIQRYGFRVEKHEMLEQRIGYIQDPESMLQNLYQASHWVVTKC